MNKLSQTASPDDIDITALWKAVADSRKLLLLSALGIGLLTFLTLSIVTPEYTATTRIMIENDETIYNQPTGQNQNRDTARLDKEAVISQVHVLRSPDLASDVIGKLRLAIVPEFNSALRTGSFLTGIFGGNQGTEEERVLRAFEDKLIVYPIKESRIISVAMTSEDPKLAAAAANALAEGYIAWQRGRQVNQTKGESESLGRQLEDLRKEVAKADFRLEKFRSETGLYAGQNNVTLSAQQLSEVNSQLSLAKAQRSEAEARARQIQEMLKSGSVDAAPDVLRSQLIQRLLEQRVQVQRRISELSATLLPRHPRMRQLIAERAGISKQINREVRKIVTGLRNEARIAGAREMSLRESLDQVRQQAAKTGNDQVRLSLLEREAKSKRTLYEATLAKFDEASSRTGSH
ncbi:MAG: GumC family protein, partial [Hyphomicrobiaceae bacterium]